MSYKSATPTATTAATPARCKSAAVTPGAAAARTATTPFTTTAGPTAATTATHSTTAASTAASKTPTTSTTSIASRAPTRSSSAKKSTAPAPKSAKPPTNGTTSTSIASSPGSVDPTEFKALQEKHDEAQRLLEEKQGLLSVREGELEALRLQLDDAEAKAQEAAIAGEIAELETGIIEELTKELESYKSMNTTTLESLKTEKAVLEALLKEKEDEIKKEKESKEEAQIRLTCLIRLNSQYRDQIEDLEQKIECLQRQTKSLQLQIVSLQLQFGSRHQQIESLQQQIGSRQQHMESLQQQVDELLLNVELGKKHAEVVEKIQAAHAAGLKMLRETAEIEEHRFKGALQPLPYQWFWMGDVRGKHYKGQQWIKYDRDENLVIENAYIEWCSPVSMNVSNSGVAIGVNYEIFFGKVGHFQRNKKSDYKRYIMRKDITIPIMAEADLLSTQVTSNNNKNPTPVECQHWKELVEFVPASTCVDTVAAAKELKSLVKLKTEYISMTGHWEKIDTAERDAAVRMIARRLFMDVEFDTKENMIKLTGHEGFVDTMRAEVYKWAFDKSGNIGNELPKDWDKFDYNVNCVLVALSTTNKEWKTVVAHVNQTMPLASIQKIERVQNRHLWFTYQHNYRQLSEKNGGQANVKSLFHGTRSTPPSNIYDSEEGFDPRFSAQGMWGKGCYFAVKASYSHNYSSVDALGNRQFFLADVITGDSITMPSDKTITLPPIKAGQTGKFQNERFDSINGNTNGSNVYILYSPGRFYPKYLITYKQH